MRVSELDKQISNDCQKSLSLNQNKVLTTYTESPENNNIGYGPQLNYQEITKPKPKRIKWGKH